jgi:hypothetical protein
VDSIDKEILQDLPAMEFTANILHFTLYSISSILDLLKRTSQATINKLNLPRDISGKNPSQFG